MRFTDVSGSPACRQGPGVCWIDRDQSGSAIRRPAITDSSQREPLKRKVFHRMCPNGDQFEHSAVSAVRTDQSDDTSQWPRSDDLSHELPDLLAVLSVRLGVID